MYGDLNSVCNFWNSISGKHVKNFFFETKKKQNLLDSTDPKIETKVLQKKIHRFLQHKFLNLNSSQDASFTHLSILETVKTFASSSNDSGHVSGGPFSLPSISTKEMSIANLPRKRNWFFIWMNFWMKLICWKKEKCLRIK